MAEVINIADQIPKMYLKDSKIGNWVRCPSSRTPKKKNVINKKAQVISPTFQICRFLYADITRIRDTHQKRLERITCNPIVSSTPYKKGISIIITIIILSDISAFSLNKGLIYQSFIMVDHGMP